MYRLLILAGILISAFAGCDNKDITIDRKLISSDKYLIISKGFPKKDVSNSVQRKLLAKNAALLAAQYTAQQLFVEDFNVIKNGHVEKYEVFEDYAIVHYVLEAENIEKYLKK